MQLLGNECAELICGNNIEDWRCVNERLRAADAKSRRRNSGAICPDE
jgi:hypothetical protein